MIALEREVSAGNSVFRQVFYRCAPLVVISACCVWVSLDIRSLPLAGLVTLLCMIGIDLDRRAHRRMQLIVTVLREMRKPARPVES